MIKSFHIIVYSSSAAFFCILSHAKIWMIEATTLRVTELHVSLGILVQGKAFVLNVPESPGNIILT